MRTRRRLSFSLRTLLALVAVAAISFASMAWRSHSLDWIRRRHRCIDGMYLCAWFPSADPRAAPGGLWLFGEQGYEKLVLMPGFADMPPDEAAELVEREKRLYPSGVLTWREIAALFPEAGLLNIDGHAIDRANLGSR